MTGIGNRLVAGTFTEAGPAEARAIASVLNVCFASYRDWTGPGWPPPVTTSRPALDHLRGQLTRPDVWALVAVQGDRALGHVSLGQAHTLGRPREPIAGLASLWQLFVVPDRWGSGLATTLLERGIEEARRRGYARMRLYTPLGHARARRFYEREGWSATGEDHVEPGLLLPVVEYAREL